MSSHAERVQDRFHGISTSFYDSRDGRQRGETMAILIFGRIVGGPTDNLLDLDSFS